MKPIRQSSPVMLTVILLVFLFASSCKSKQNLTTDTTETVTKSNDTVITEKTVVNQAIIDELFVKIKEIQSAKPECDSLINYYRIELLRAIAFQKQSGDNSYEVKYNEALQQLEFLIKIQETQHKQKTQTTAKAETKIIKKNIEVPVKLPLTWWEKLFYWTGIAFMGTAAAMVLFFILKSKFKK